MNRKIQTKRGKTDVKKALCRTLCLILLIILVVPAISSCGKEKNAYELGEYVITEKEYNYLLGLFKKRVMVSLDPSLTDDELVYEMENGVTIANYIESTYRQGFEQSVLTLLYAQSLFDKLGLSLTDEEMSTIKASATAVCAYFGGYDMDQFDKIAEPYGFDSDTLFSVYEKQFKENKVRQHLLGASNEKITDKQKSDYYYANYMRYQLFVVNTTYKTYVEDGEVKMLPLNEDEKKEKTRLVTELKELLINKNLDFDYIILKDQTHLSYEELWELYDDDNRENGHYKYGCYSSSNPTIAELDANNTLSAAFLSTEGEVRSVIANRYFSDGGTLGSGDDKITINPGDYFEYGTVFVKRLPLNEKAYELEENKDFFGATFMPAVANSVYYNILAEHEKSLPYQTMVSDKVNKITFSSIKSNDLDYYFLYGEQ